MEKLVDKGKTKLIGTEIPADTIYFAWIDMSGFIGLSNFNILKLKRILEIARIRPTVNQVELHP